MSPLPDEIIRELQKEYIATFPEKLNVIEKEFEQKNWPGLLHVFHKLAGSGATYSMPEISELCRSVEMLLAQNKNPSVPVVSESIIVLKKIFDCRRTGQAYELTNDPILKKIRTT